jgi:hypothetical protein
VTVPELLRKAAACKTCGRPHDYLPRSDGHGRTWASPEDGHGYGPLLDPNRIAEIRRIATGKYESPWVRKGVAVHWWTEEIVKES